MAEEKRPAMRPEDYQADLDGQPKMICRRCRVEMEPAETFFEYLDHAFHTKLLRCPQCGEVYIPEELARGKMAEVETNMEDK